MRRTEEKGGELDGVLSVSSGKDAVVLGQSGEGVLQMFWLRQGRDGVQLFDGDGGAELSRGDQTRRRDHRRTCCPSRSTTRHTHASKKKREEKKQLADQIIELNQVALEFWESELQKKNKERKPPANISTARGISDEIQKTFRIGFSPDKWDALLERASR